MLTKHVVIVNDFGYVNGGASRVALASAVGLARAGYDVRLFTGSSPEDDELERAGVQVTSTGQDEIGATQRRAGAAVQGLWNRRAAHVLREVLSGMDVNRTVVHVHGWTKILSASVISEALAADFALTCTLHDYFAVCPNGGLFNYRTGQSCQVVPMSFDCVTTDCDSRRYAHKLWRVLRHGVQTHIARFPRALNDLIFVSQFSRDLLGAAVGAARTHVIENPVDVPQAPPVVPARNEQFIYVGRLSKEKGPLVLAKAARRLGMAPVFVGDGELRAAVLDECPAALITGWLSPVSVAEHVSRARALVFPSLWHETHGLAVMEALARGVPAVVSDGTAAAGSIRHEQTGLLFTRGDEDDLARKLTRLLNDASVERLGAAAYAQYWRSPLTTDIHVSKLSAVYERMLESRRCRCRAG